MTKKDYIMLAESIRLNTDTTEPDYLHKTFFLMDLIVKLKANDPAFDFAPFLAACLYEDGKGPFDGLHE